MVEEDSESVCGELVTGREDSDDGDDDYDNVTVSSSTKRAKLTKTSKESRRKAELIKATNCASQRTNVTTKDRLSALPDSLLLYILYYLQTKEVMRTCVLSKRWQFLWTDSSELWLIENSNDIAKNRSFVDSVGRILVMCSGIHLNKLCVSFWYQQCYASNVNLWVQFAVKNKVKEFNLECLSNKDRYLLPQMLYSNSSFTNLSLNCGSIAPRGAIYWRFLKSLSIKYVELTEFVLQKILSSCPVLEFLRLSLFWGLNHLKVLSRSLSKLVVDGWKNSNQCDCLDISAPYVRALSVSANKVTRFIIGGGSISSLVTAKLDYTFAEDAATFSQVDLRILPGVQQSLESFRSVKKLELGPWCIEVLSRLEEKGLHLSPSTRLCLTLTAWRHKRSIAGILNILKSSPNLETLVIRGASFKPHLISDTHNQAAAYLRDDSLDLVLHSLKTVNISGFSEAGLGGEPMLTLVQLLLKSAIILEKMVIDAKDLTGSSSTTCCKISLKLLSFARSSPKAVVVVR